MSATKEKVEIKDLKEKVKTPTNPTAPKEHDHHHPIRHAEGHKQIPFATVYNPRRSDPLDHHYHSLVHDLEEMLTPAISTVLKKLVQPKDAEGHGAHVDPDKTILAMLDVHQFAPEELIIKMKGDELVIEGKHEEKHDGHGFIKRNIVRRISIPSGIERKEINCHVNHEGILDISVPKKKGDEVEVAERTLPIQYARRSTPGPVKEANGTGNGFVGKGKRHYGQEIATAESKVKNGP